MATTQGSALGRGLSRRTLTGDRARGRDRIRGVARESGRAVPRTVDAPASTFKDSTDPRVASDSSRPIGRGCPREPCQRVTSFQRMGASPELRRATFIRAPAEKVYPLIATAEGLDRWFTSGASLDPRPNGEIVYRWRDWGPDRVTTEARGTVHEAVPSRRFVFDWDVGHGQRAVAEFTIEPADGGCVLRLREHGYDDSDEGHRALADQASGWGEAMTLIKFMAEHGLRY